MEFDYEKFNTLALRFVEQGIFVTAGGGSVRIMAEEAAEFFGLPYQAMLTALGGNSEHWHRLFYAAGGYRSQGYGDAAGFGRFLQRNW